MRVHIHTDLEGVSGIDRAEMIDRDGEEFGRCRELLMGDVNAAVEGAFEGGASDVVVLDRHGGGANFLLDRLDARAVVDSSPNGKWWGSLDATVDATFFVGAHAMAGTMNGFLDHTMSSVHWYECRINGRPTGELGLWAVVAGHFGVPLTMVSGDQAACVEAQAFFPGVSTAEVKRGVGRNRAVAMPLEEARTRIRAAAADGVQAGERARPYLPIAPLECELHFTRSDYADDAAQWPGVERTGARVVRWLASDRLRVIPW
ncbi:MAG TPA: M55 family metallopeptidase [Chthonomonadales bacterium]|nr:M55 family metallopeptidase [Chthonomonadales bacterium]